MPYVAKSEDQKRKALGISLDSRTVAHIDALIEASIPGGGGGRRSMFLREIIELGMAQRFGPNWRAMAERLRTDAAGVAA